MHIRTLLNDKIGKGTPWNLVDFMDTRTYTVHKTSSVPFVTVLKEFSSGQLLYHVRPSTIQCVLSAGGFQHPKVLYGQTFVDTQPSQPERACEHPVPDLVHHTLYLCPQTNGHIEKLHLCFILFTTGFSVSEMIWIIYR